MNKHLWWLAAAIALFPLYAVSAAEPGPVKEWVEVARDGKGFLLTPSSRPFTPWGFNYDRDERSRLLEEYWEAEWPTVAADFQEMKDLGANVVRIHLQVGKFLRGPAEPDRQALDRLDQLIALGERSGLYLDITGLACYRKADVPEWYDALDETGRWRAQATFWQAIAERCSSSPAVFCYDLMNEPVVPGGKRKDRDWLGPPLGEFSYVQCITLDQADRPRPEVARRWIETLVEAIRAKDKRHLITVGLVDWSLDRPGLSSGFVPSKVSERLDFLCVHLYPQAKKVDEALETLRGFAAVGKPVIIEETFPLQCSFEEFQRFLDESRTAASGWLGFYWGKTREEYRQSKTIVAALMLGWLDLFAKQDRARP
ncbi:MAG TPA: cellulase family glycosylhydrolase [Isosphaeraceae bacterium]|jgi:hypothetical protein|nr:cellulase family glycosylhydrolase [Isosphaeraceae bacterium]